MLLGDYALSYVRGLSRVDARTRHDYERDLTRHLLPVFGHVDIRDGHALDRALVRRWVNQLQHGQRDGPARWRPLRPKTIQNLHGCCTRSCKTPSRRTRRYAPWTPRPAPRLPRSDDGEGDEEMVFLTREELAVLRACAKPDVRDMLTVFAGTGLRYAELAALQVRDVNRHHTGDAAGPLARYQATNRRHCLILALSGFFHAKSAPDLRDWIADSLTVTARQF